MTRALLLIGLVLAAAGCSSAPAAVAMSNGWQVELRASPEQPAALQPMILSLTITGPREAPVAFDEVTATARMPQMTHEDEVTVVVLQPVAPGRYLSTMTFSMDGEWEIAVTGRRDGRRYEARIPLLIGR